MLAKHKMSFQEIITSKKPTGRGKLVEGLSKRIVEEDAQQPERLADLSGSPRSTRSASKRLSIMSPCDRGGADQSEGSNSKRKTKEIPSDLEDDTLANIKLKMSRMNAAETDGDDDDDFVDDVPFTVKLGKASSSENKERNVLEKGKAKMSDLKPRK
ncbi:hypothetical protein V2J09_016483 [Rumex salicifolius]